MFMQLLAILDQRTNAPDIVSSLMCREYEKLERENMLGTEKGDIFFKTLELMIDYYTE